MRSSLTTVSNPTVRFERWSRSGYSALLRPRIGCRDLTISRKTFDRNPSDRIGVWTLDRDTDNPHGPSPVRYAQRPIIIGAD